jgi:hypothetical protein
VRTAAAAEHCTDAHASCDCIGYLWFAPVRDPILALPNLCVMSVGLLLDDRDAAVVLRGPRKQVRARARALLLVMACLYASRLPAHVLAGWVM